MVSSARRARAVIANVAREIVTDQGTTIQGRFECLALAPSTSAGSAESGNFNTNVMYVTGEITSGRTSGQTAVLRGTATVTGVGAGSNETFTVTLRRGGPGATLVLEVSGLTFEEILLEGRFQF
jgi:hypothetical protein